jgi:crossover junction endodeoxyribonuclease RusA
VALSITFYFKTKRRRDLNNQNKLVLDALSGIVYGDDAQVAALHLMRRYDAARPRIEVQAPSSVCANG